jgi:hypothetical protein
MFAEVRKIKESDIKTAATFALQAGGSHIG